MKKNDKNKINYKNLVNLIISKKQINKKKKFFL